MTSETETFVFHSKFDGDEKTISAEPSPTYTMTSKDGSKEEKKPSSVFTLRHTPDGQVEFTSNRKIIRVQIETKYATEPAPENWSCSTTIHADIIPSNKDVIKQVEQDVYNAQTKAVLHGAKFWNSKKNKAENIAEAPVKKRSWWSFRKTKSA